MWFQRPAFDVECAKIDLLHICVRLDAERRKIIEDKPLFWSLKSAKSANPAAADVKSKSLPGAKHLQLCCCVQNFFYHHHQHRTTTDEKGEEEGETTTIQAKTDKKKDLTNNNQTKLSPFSSTQSEWWPWFRFGKSQKSSSSSDILF